MRRGLPSADIARALQIRADAQVWRLRRLRMIDGQPAVVETSIIPARRSRPSSTGWSAGWSGSLYDLLGRECGLVDEYEEQYLEVIMPTQEERRLLSIAAADPGGADPRAEHGQGRDPVRLLRAALPGGRVRVRHLRQPRRGTCSRRPASRTGTSGRCPPPRVTTPPGAGPAKIAAQPGLATQGNHWPPVGPCERKRPCPRHQAASRGSTSPEQPTPAGSRRTRCGPATS